MATSPITIGSAPTRPERIDAALRSPLSRYFSSEAASRAAAVNDDHADRPAARQRTRAPSDVDGSALPSGVSSREYSTHSRPRESPTHVRRACRVAITPPRLRPRLSRAH